jgi:thiamine biosynthesis lipoprotein ApbE
MKVALDLNEITKGYKNKQAEWVFIRNAIKSAIVDEKIKNGIDVEIEFIQRKSDNPAFDLAINGTANRILTEFENSN